MSLTVNVDTSSAVAKLEAVGPTVRDAFAASLRTIEQAMLADARANAEAHFHSVGAKPGAYFAAFEGGVKQTDSAVIGYVRNANPLAHLLENGFTISDLTISAANVMRFELAGVGEIYRREIHRHATPVQAYPAITPAFEAHVAEVEAAALQATAKL